MGSIYAIKIESLGDGTSSPAGSDKRYRFATRTPSWDDEGLYLPALRVYPESASVGFDPQLGDLQGGGATFELSRTPYTEGAFMRSRWSVVAYLQAAISSSATSISLANTGLAGRTLVLEREALYLSSHSGGGVYVCSRGQLGTQARAHGAAAEDDTELYDADHGSALELREVVLVRVSDAATATYTDEEVLRRYVLAPQGVDWNGETRRIVLQCDSAISLLRRRTILGSRAVWRLSSEVVSPGRAPILEYRTAPGQWSASVPSPFPSATGDGRVVLSLGGKAAVIAPVSAIGADEGSAYLSATLSQAVLWDGSVPIPQDPPQEAWEVLSTAPSAPSDADTPSTNTLPLSSDPLTLALQLLTSTVDGGNVESGLTDYDLGIAQLDASIPASLVDVAGIEALRLELGALPQLHLQLGMASPGPVELLPLLAQQVLRPFGLALTQTSTGRLTIVRAAADALGYGSTAAAITAADCRSKPRVRRNAPRAIDRVEVHYDARPGLQARVAAVSNVYAARRRLSGGSPAESLAAYGVQDEAVARGLGIDYVSRWHWPVPGIVVEVTASVEAWPGQLVTLTHPLLPGPDGSPGMDAGVCLVVAREDRWAQHRAALELWYVGALYARVAAWGPTATVASWSSPTCTVEANVAVDADNARFASDAAAFGALLTLTGLSTLSLEIRDSDYALLGYATLSGVSGNDLTLSYVSTAPAAGNLLTLADYATAQTAVQDAVFDHVAYLADANDTLGASSEEPHEWTG